MRATKQSTARRLMPLWIGLGVLVALIASGVCIWLYGGGKYSGSRLKEVNNDDVVWTGSPKNNSPTNFFFYLKINVAGDKEKFMNPDFSVTTPHDEKDKSSTIWDETTSSYYELSQSTPKNSSNNDDDPGDNDGADSGGDAEATANTPSGDGAGVATEGNGTKLSARIVEYDQRNNKICEVLVVEGKLQGPGYIWDAKGRLLHKAEFKEGKPRGSSTIKSYDSDGNEVYVRKLWWNDSSRLTKEQVYRDSKILWEVHYENEKMLLLKRWTNWRVKQALEIDGGKVETPEKNMKCVELLNSARSYRKLKMELLNIHGLPKERETGFAELLDENEKEKNYSKGVPPPTYLDIKKQIAATPWGKALLAKMEEEKLEDTDSPYEKDKEDDKKSGGDSASGETNPPQDPPTP